MHTPSMSFNSSAQFALSLPRYAKRLLAVAMDASMCVLTVWLALCLRLESWVLLEGVYWISVIGSLVIAIPIFIAFGLYRAIFRFAGWAALATVAQAVALYAVFYIVIFTAIGFRDIPRTVGLLQPILLLLTVGTSRLLARYWLGGNYIQQLQTKPSSQVLVYGAGTTGIELATALKHSRDMRVVGFLDDNPGMRRGVVSGMTVYGPQDLAYLVQTLRVTDVLLALPSITRQRRNAILSQMSKARVAVRTLPSLTDLAQGRISADDLRELDIEDLLGRETVQPNPELLSKNIVRKIVLVTGAGGSIGSELCRQILAAGPCTLVLVELSEFALYTIHAELSGRLKASAVPAVRLVTLIGSVQDTDRMRYILSQWQPDTIYHAAAYKHVPIVEDNPVEGIKNNVFGTLKLAQMAIQHQVTDFVLISTDKAVRPTNVMGASKRLAEMILQALAAHFSTSNGSITRFSMVRFGNVLGSSGSVVPKFRQQIKNGGPISLTHLDITRFFMTIPEAAGLVIQAGALAELDGERGEVFVLDMGEPVKIMDLARSMVQLSGMTVRDESQPDGDIAIEITGLRPGEKLFEELLIGNDPKPTQHPKIMKANEEFIAWPELSLELGVLAGLLSAQDAIGACQQVKKLVPEFTTTEQPALN